MMPEQPGPFENEEGEDEEDELEDEGNLLIVKCRLMVERKPRSCNGECIKMNQATWEMTLCDQFTIVDATEEEEAEYDSIEEN